MKPNAVADLKRMEQIEPLKNLNTDTAILTEIVEFLRSQIANAPRLEVGKVLSERHR